MAEIKTWAKKHKFWSALIILILVGMIGNLFGLGEETSVENNKQQQNIVQDNTEYPTEKEIEIHDKYFELLYEETVKLYDAQDAGLEYKYKGILVNDAGIQLENLVKVDVTQIYGITKKELEDIYLKVEVYNNQQQNTVQDNTETTENTASKLVGVGEEGLLHQEDNSEVGICWTKESFDEMVDASFARDTIGFTQLFYDGDCYLAPSNTKVLVLENSWTGSSKFRILDGDFYGEVAWTNYEYVVPV